MASYVGKVSLNGVDYSIGSTLYGVCRSAASDSVKIVEVEGFDTLFEGLTLNIKFVNSNTAINPQINVNRTGLKRIIEYGTTSPGVLPWSSWLPGSIVTVVYDGEKWMMASDRAAIKAYPVGSIYMSINNTNPQLYFGGVWERLEDMFLLAAGQTYTAGSTGGEAAHTLTVNEMPAHSHSTKEGNGVAGGTWYLSSGQYTGYNATSQTINAGGGAAHNNMPPYLAVYVWKRIA